MVGDPPLTNYVRSFFYLFVAITFLSGRAEIQEFDKLTVDDGLSQNSVTCIFQDSRGFMWFGAQDGLNRYDGYDITVFNYDPDDSTTISSLYIIDIVEDSRQNLWIGTVEGLNRLDLKTGKITRFMFTSENKNTLPNRINTLLVDNLDRLWVGTFGDGLYVSDLATEQKNITFKNYHHDQMDSNSLCHDNVYNLYQDRYGNIWIGTKAGLNKYLPETDNFLQYQNIPDDTTSLSHNNISALFRDLDGYLWVGTRYSGWLNRLDPVTHRFRHYQALNLTGVSAIAEDSSGVIWFGGEENRGLTEFNKWDQSFTHIVHDDRKSGSLSGNMIADIYVDRSGIIWIASLLGGVNKLDYRKSKFRHFQHNPADANSLSANHIWSIFEDHLGKVWIGTWGGGVNVYDPETGKFKQYKNDPLDPASLSSDWVYVILEDHSQSIWIGTVNGLNKFNRARDSFKIYRRSEQATGLTSSRITSLYEDRKGNLWIGTMHGLNTWNNRTQTFSRYFNQDEEPGSNIIFHIYEDHTGTFWISTTGGLYTFYPATGKFLRFPLLQEKSGKTSSNYVSFVHEDKNGNLWLATVEGLKKYERTGDKIFHFGMSDGLPSMTINGMLEDDQGFLWISTGSGLSRFDPRTRIFRNYIHKDGLQSREFNDRAFHKGNSGYFFFGGINGFNMFRPEDVHDNPYIPPVVLTSLHFPDAPGAEISLFDTATSIRLLYEQNDFTLRFVALNFTNSENNQYAYKLEGYRDEWINCGTQRQATFTNIDPGAYIFHVKASNNDGIWSERSASLPIYIAPPYWRAWWFRMLIMMLLTGLIYLLYRYRVSRLLEIERLRIQIASDLHDDIGSSLTKIAVHSEIIKTTTDAKKIRASSQKIGDMSRGIITTLSDIIWSIDARNDRLGDLVDRMRDFLDQSQDESQPEIIFNPVDIEEELKIGQQIRQNVYLIFKELVNNAIKHARASKIEVQLYSGNGILSLSVADNGDGFEPQPSSAGHQGIKNMYMRAGKINAHLQIERTNGTCITLAAKLV